MIRQCTGKRNLRKIIAYDFEWVPDTYAVRIAGMFDGTCYRSFESVEAFLAHALTSKYRGQWFFAHAGGKYDIQFIFDVLIDNPAFRIEAAFSGSSAIRVNVKRGKNVWHFIDSVWLLKGTLAEIGKNLGLHKTGPTDDMTDEERKAWYATVDYKTLEKYNENDCVLLWQALREFELAILDLGGQLQTTLASTGMFLFRRKYLEEKIHTSEIVNKRAVESYTASRVEVFQTDCDRARYYDINSSFPYAMTFPVPGDLIRRLPRLSESLIEDDETPLMVFASVSVSDCYLPPLPYRVPGKIFFPVGSWTSWFTSIDLRILLENGGSIERVYDVLEFEPRWDLREYALDLYKQRMASDDPFHRMLYKLLLNTLYGKWAERREKRTMIANPSAEKYAAMKAEVKATNERHKTDIKLRDYMLRPGVYLMPHVRYIPHRHVPISAYITARARKTLYDFITDMPDVHYCDTDGFSTTGLASTSDELGGLKLEKVINHGEFLKPKLYMLDGWVLKNGQWERKTIVKAKGFSIDKLDNPIDMFNTLKKGGSMTINRMYRTIENLRRGAKGPRDHEVVKLVKLDSISKRFIYPDGQTRPWCVEEVNEMV